MEPQIKYEYISKVTKQSTIFYLLFKRMMDIILSLLVSLILLPFFIALIAIIKLDSPGPAFFAHKRYGKNGEFIKIYKFRSMYKNAQEMLLNLTPEQKKEFQENFKLKNDPRITKVGKFLRRTSLDELPQLFNILIGDMSIVGPRPIIEKELDKYGIYAEKFLSVKPGLTGMWQISGRSDTTYAERVLLDMEYIDSRTFWGDFIIIFKTILVVFRKSGAY